MVSYRMVACKPVAGVAVGVYLELQTTLDVLLQRLGDGLVKVAEDLHRQLRVDALLAD